MPDQRLFALFRNNFLPLSETFIHDELRFHERYRGVVFARRTLNREHFPGHEVLSLDREPLGRFGVDYWSYAVTTLSPRFFRAIRERPFDLVHAHFGYNGIYAAPYAATAKLPLIVSLHGHDVTMLHGSDRRSPSWLHYTARARWLFERTTLFLAASSEMKELVVDAGCDPSKVVLHRLGIDLSRFRPTPYPGDEPLKTALMVGRLVEKKGFRYGLRAFAAALKSGIPGLLHVVGEGPQRAELQDLAESLGVAGSVRFHGALASEKVRALFESAHVVLTPSVVAPDFDRESGLIVAKEGSACARPVLGTWHGGIPDIVEEERTGFLVQERDVGSMAERLVFLWSHPDRAAEMGLAGRRKMEAEYDIRIRNRVLEGLYDLVASGVRPDPLNYP